ncbi:hypothetical protein MT418_004588 [Batrachochytrium dendrobatidis]
MHYHTSHRQKPAAICSTPSVRSMLSTPQDIKDHRELDDDKPPAVVVLRSEVKQEFQHLVVQPDECVTLMTAIDAQDMDLAGHCVKVYFDLSQALLALDTARFNPTFKSTSAMLELKSITYDRHAEDLQMHETILAQYLLEAACCECFWMFTFVHRLGLTPVQCAIWLTIFKTSHHQHITYRTDMTKCIDIFQENIQKFGVFKNKQVFSAYETKLLVEYIVSGYVQHVRLIACTFTTSQNVMIQKVRKVIELVPDPLPFLPLSQGVPADKWDEVCRFEEEQAVLAQVAKAEAIEAARLQAIADIKLKADTERVAYLLKQQSEAEQALAAPFAELSHTTITIPSVDTIFRDVPIIVFNATAQHAQHAQQESENDHLADDKWLGADLKSKNETTFSHPTITMTASKSIGLLGSSNAKLEQSIGPVVAQTTRSKDSSRLLQAYTSSDTNHTLLHRASHSTLHTVTMQTPMTKSNAAIVSQPNSDNAAMVISRSNIVQAITTNITDMFKELEQSLMGKMDLQLGDMASRIDRVHSAMVAREEYRLSKEKHTGTTKQSAFPVAASHIASSAHLVGKEGADRDGRESSRKRLGQLSSASKK